MNTLELKISNKENKVFQRLKKMLSLKTSPPTPIFTITEHINLKKTINSSNPHNLTLTTRKKSILTSSKDENDKLQQVTIETQAEIETDVVSINYLPVELICKIFDYLTYNERKNASLVNKKWRSAHLQCLEMNRVVLKANNNLFLSQRPQLTATTTSLSIQHRAASSKALTSTFNFNLFRNLVNLEFDNDSADINLLLRNLQVSDNPNAEHHLLPPPLLPKLKTLKIFKTNLSARTLIDLLAQTPNLKSLSLIQCNSLFMTGFLAYNTAINPGLGLGKLEDLFLARNRYLSDSLLNFFTALASGSLKSLDLSFCYLTKTKFKSLSNNNNTNNNNATAFSNNINSNVVLTVENLLKLVENLPLLHWLNLSGIDLFNHDDEALFALVEKIETLDRLYLANLPNLKVDTISCIFERKLTNLSHIDLSGSVQVDDFRQKSVETCFLRPEEGEGENLILPLQVLKMNKARINNPDLFVDQLACFSRLTHLDLSCAMFQRSFGSLHSLNRFIEKFSSNLCMCAQMEKLELSYCDFLVNDTFMQLVSQSLVKLKHLDLRNCTQITDNSLHYICKYLKNLVFLDLSWCQSISDYGLYSKSIDNTDSEKKDALLDEFNKHLNSRCRCMRRCIEQPFMLLRIKAELAAQQSENSGEVQTSFCTCKNEKNTKESGGQSANQANITRLDPNEILSFKNLTKLKVLKLESCVNISNAGLYYGVELAQLEELDLKLCTSINGDFIFSLVDSTNQTSLSLNNLKTLNLNQCAKFKEENLAFIIENARNLRELSVSALPNVTNAIIDLLHRSRRFLALFDVSFCPQVNEASVDMYEQFLFSEFGSRDFVLDKRFISK